jgi:hypothetical protein
VVTNWLAHRQEPARGDQTLALQAMSELARKPRSTKGTEGARERGRKAAVANRVTIPVPPGADTEEKLRVEADSLKQKSVF